MNYNTPCDPSSWRETGFVLDLDSLAIYFESLHDQRCARGKRYRLAQVCILTTLAKLCGEDQPSGIAQWFAPESHVKGFSPTAKDFQTARIVNKGHGRRTRSAPSRSPACSTIIWIGRAWPRSSNWSAARSTP